MRGEVILVVLVLGEHGLDRLGGTECLVDGLTGRIGANTRFLRGIGKPGGAGRLEDEHCVMTAVSTLDFLIRPRIFMCSFSFLCSRGFCSFVGGSFELRFSFRSISNRSHIRR